MLIRKFIVLIPLVFFLVGLAWLTEARPVWRMRSIH